MKKDLIEGRKMMSAIAKHGFIRLSILLLLLCVMAIPAFAAGPTLSKSEVTVYVGTEKKLTVTNPKHTAVQWKSSNKNVVSVKKSSENTVRLLAGPKTGNAVVTVKVSGETLKCQVKVKDWSFYFSNGKTIGVGDSTTLQFRNVKGRKFRSGNKKVATVNKNGKIKGKAPGKCNIYYSVGRYDYYTQITVQKNKPAPDLVIGTHVYKKGGSDKSTSTRIQEGKTGKLEIINSEAGTLHEFYLFANHKEIRSGISFSSSNKRVLTFAYMDDGWAEFYSQEDGSTTLTMKYDDPNSNQTCVYKCQVTIRDDNRSYYDKQRKQIYQSAGIHSGLTKQKQCFLLASWICDQTIYSPEVKANLAEAQRGVNASFKDFFRSHKLVCSGYTDLYMYLCFGLSIPCRQVVWAGGSHIWNQVKIDGHWYNVDVTWMDSEKEKCYDFAYFLTSDEGMNRFSSQGHAPSPDYPCTTKRFDRCCEEQLSLQNEYLRKEYPHLYTSYSYYSPWLTGNWIYY